MNHLTTLTPEQARENLFNILHAANISTKLFNDIADAATDWNAVADSSARQAVLNAYRGSVSIPHDSTYPTA